MRPIPQPWLEGLRGYDPNRVSVVEIEDPDAVTDEDIAAMEAAEGPPPAPVPPQRAATKPRRTRNSGRGRTV